METIDSAIREVDCGENVRVVQPSNLYECTLGDDVFIGPFVEIQAGVVVGPRTKVQSHSFICELVSIGADCFIGHGVVFINDLFQHGKPAMGNRKLWKETKVGDNVSIGSNATILPVSICSGSVIGAGAVVVNDIAERGIYVGNPATKIRGL